MSEPVPNPFTNNQGSNASPSGNVVSFYTQDLDQLKQTVEKFKATGQVDPSELDFAKKEVLPKLGLKSEEISDLGPVGVMVRLQNEVEKGSLGDLGEKPEDTKKESAESEPKSENPQPKPNGANPIEQSTEVDADLPESLTSDQIQKLTHNLSSEIDQEIKRQIAEKHALDLAQEKIDQVLTNNEPKPLGEATVEEKVQPVPAVANAEILDDVRKTEESKLETGPNSDSIPVEVSQVTDPLSQSVGHALENLKEGDKVGSEWTLKKIFTTSFGNSKSPFYELENKSGAKWTLSPEEMKDTLRSHILSEKKIEKEEKPTLGVSKIKPTSLHPLEGKKIVHDIVTRPLEQIIKTVRKEHPAKPSSGAKPEIKKVEIPIKEIPHLEVRPVLTTTKAVPNSEEKPPEEKKLPPVSSESTNLSQKQIDFIGKVHSDKDSWRAFTSFTAPQWSSVNQLYKEGKLIDLGIDAHPLIDKLTDPDFVHIVDVHKGDSFNKILEDAGHNLTYTGEDSKIIGAHLIANHQLLIDSTHKAEASGFATASVPSDKEIIDLIYSAENGNHEAFYQLQEPLHQLPISSKFKIIKPEQLEEIKDFFRK